jgi:hypothetical protein
VVRGASPLQHDPERPEPPCPRVLDSASSPAVALDERMARRSEMANAPAPLAALPFADVPLADVPLPAIPLATVPFTAVPLAAAGEEDAARRSAPALALSGLRRLAALASGSLDDPGPPHEATGALPGASLERELDRLLCAEALRHGLATEGWGR